jgi:hypothetical protein
MLGIGAWAELARETSAAAEELSGVWFEVVTEAWREVPHPSWLKLWVAERFPKSDGWLVMDADMVPLRRWQPEKMLEESDGRLLIARDREHPAVVAECREHRLRVEDYSNGGLMLFGRRGAAVLEHARQWFPRLGRWMEQTAVAKAAEEMESEVCRIRREYNLVVGPEQVLRDPAAVARRAVTAHVVGLRGDLKRFRECREAVRSVAG